VSEGKRQMLVWEVCESLKATKQHQSEEKLVQHHINNVIFRTLHSWNLPLHNAEEQANWVGG